MIAGEMMVARLRLAIAEATTVYVGPFSDATGTLVTPGFPTAQHRQPVVTHPVRGDRGPLIVSWL